MIIEPESYLTQKFVSDIAKFVEAFYYGCKINVPELIKASEVLKTGKIAQKENLLGQIQINAVDLVRYVKA